MSKLVLNDIIVKRKSPFTFKGRENVPDYNPRNKKHHQGTYIFAIFTAIILIGGAFSLSVFFSGATVTVYPKKETVSIDKNVSAGTSGGVQLKFKMVQVSKTESVETLATGQKEENKKASGTIVVYNTYGPKSKKLIKNTRFETSDGKIYRTNSSVTVPGMTVLNGKNIPGTAETVVYADEPGEEYNIGLTDFTIPGFKGDSRYQKFYARSKTDMHGGTKGFIYTISKDDESNIKDVLERRLTEALLKDARKNTPPEYVLFSSATSFDFSDLKITNSGSGKKVTVQKTGTLYVPIWERAVLSKYIAQVSVNGYAGEPISSLNLDTLTISLKDKSILSSPKLETMNVYINGETTIVWLFDEKSLVADLRGKPKQNFQSILKKYAGIDKAELVVAPPWSRTITERAEDISIKTITE
ncbi:MAG: hypothetical protein AAB355_03125 [Patescibacteria group bacterium]